MLLARATTWGRNHAGRCIDIVFEPVVDTAVIAQRNSEGQHDADKQSLGPIPPSGGCWPAASVRGLASQLTFTHRPTTLNVR
jgi:hypothetical protein